MEPGIYIVLAIIVLLIIIVISNIKKYHRHMYL